jgi:hypothetical protein
MTQMKKSHTKAKNSLGSNAKHKPTTLPPSTTPRRGDLPSIVQPRSTSGVTYDTGVQRSSAGMIFVPPYSILGVVRNFTAEQPGALSARMIVAIGFFPLCFIDHMAVRMLEIYR